MIINIQMIEFELEQKFKGMSFEDYKKFLCRLNELYWKHHNGTIDENGNVWIERK